jgi:hypothetical protein
MARSAQRDARRTAFALWRNLGLPGQLSQELALAALLEQAVELVDEEEVTSTVPCGPDPERHLDVIRTYAHAGYDAVFVHQIGSDQEGFLGFFAEEVLPKV